ncbi:MAG: hypothetical protein HRU17_02560 [Polyangiaceae bacterium]|nr:hypothetical protein [Polyangiaceae bacterium]
MHYRNICALVLGLAALCLSAPVSAQSAANKAAAEALFENGMKLLEAKNYSEACGKFDASQKLDPGVGTLLYLGECYEQDGKLASAWATFHEAASIARTRNDDDRADIAKQRADALRPRLVTLTVEVDPANQGLKMKIEHNGRVVPDATWGVPIPVDPGEQTLSVTAPSKKPFEMSMHADDPKMPVTLKVPPLEDVPAVVAGTDATTEEPANQTPADEPAAETSTVGTIGIVVAVVGAVALSAGLVFGSIAKSKADESLDDCDTVDQNRCNADGVALRNEALDAATFSTVAGIAGGVLIATGVTLYITAPSPAGADTASSSSGASARAWTLGLQGSF